MEIRNELLYHLNNSIKQSEDKKLSEEVVRSTVEFLVQYFDEKIKKCDQAKISGVCKKWGHEDCDLLMKILFDLTLDKKYVS